jgi:sirohydrochlorin cobaltochelatase
MPPETLVAALPALILPALLLLAARPAKAFELEPRRPAIVLAAFGTTVPEALADLENVEGRVRAAFPDHDVHMAFTSNMIRLAWRRRAEAGETGAKRWAAVGSPLAVLAGIQDEGSRIILVQSLHVTDGEEYRNLATMIEALSGQEALQASLRPFPDLRLGPPALGLGDGDPLRLDRAARALAGWLDEARRASASLVLVGHGNERLRQEVFRKLEARLRRDYPRVHLGTVETEPGPEAVAEMVAADPPPSGQVMLAPLMLVAGDHARQDMAGDDPGSFKSRLSAKRLAVVPRLAGLGSLDSWADIYVESLGALTGA